MFSFLKLIHLSFVKIYMNVLPLRTDQMFASTKQQFWCYAPIFLCVCRQGGTSRRYFDFVAFRQTFDGDVGGWGSLLLIVRLVSTDDRRILEDFVEAR